VIILEIVTSTDADLNERLAHFALSALLPPPGIGPGKHRGRSANVVPAALLLISASD
jgi:hypothetical protein